MSRQSETTFLPAALEIQETPPSPAGRAVLWLILAFFVSAVVWATLGETDIVAVAQGRIVASGHTKTVQPLEIGTVTAIHVAEGQRVAAGDVLIELDPRTAEADIERLNRERDSARREVACFRQLADWAQREGPPDLEERRPRRALVVEGAGDLVGEIHVSRRIDQVKLVLPAGLVGIGQGHGLALDGDTPFTLDIHRVEHLVTEFPLRNATTGLDQSIGQCRLADPRSSEQQYAPIARKQCGDKLVRRSI